jgi:molybdate-binding protein
LRESGSGLASLAEGSEVGIARFSAGETLAAAIHLHALDDPAADANLEMMRTRSDLYGAVLIGFCRREQGLLLASGNPLNIASIGDAAEKKARMAQRPKGAGAQLLLLALLRRANVAPDVLKSGPMCPTGPDVAQAIRAGRADVGVATRSVADAGGLHFVPIVWEPFDLLMRQRDYFRPPLQALMRLLRSDTFRARANELGGYDVSAAGSVRFVN